MHIGLVVYDPRFTYWTLLAYGARAQAAEAGVELTTLSAVDHQEQLRCIEQLLALGVDALIVGPIEAERLVPAINRVVASGTPVLCVGTPITDSDAVCSICSDSIAGASAAGGYLAALLGGQGAVAHITGPLWAPESVARADGFLQGIRPSPLVRVVYTTAGDWTRDDGARLMRAALEQHPDLRAVFAANDPMALGAADAIAAVGRAGQIRVAGFDGLPEALIATRRGTLAATVQQSPIACGRESIATALRVLAGDQVPRLVHIPTTLINNENVVDLMTDTLALMPDVLRDAVESGARLARERTLLRTVIDSVPDTHIFIKNRESKFLMSNAAHLQTMGADRVEEVIGKSDHELFPGALVQQYYADEQQVIATGQALYNRIEPVVDNAGNQKWYLTSKVPFYDDDGAIVGLVGISRDITAIRVLEDDRARLQEEIIQAQQAALRELSTPLIPLADGVVAMPLIGSIDSARAQQILETLLEGVVAQHAAFTIIDITGVLVVDTQVANALVRAAQAVRLLGAQVILTGIRPEVAQTLIGLGADLGAITTRSTLQSGVAYALAASRS